MSAPPEHFDAVVVGSGFGGSVMTYRLAEAGRRVCLLERGKSYPPGSFARSPQDMKQNFWDPSRGLQGLYNVWSFRHIGAVVSSGLGGGSLIYANVLLRKDEKWFVKEDLANGGYESWPLTRADLEPHYARVEKEIGVNAYPFDASPFYDTPKTQAMREAAAALARSKPGQTTWGPLPLAVTFANSAGPPVPGEPIPEAIPNLHGRTRTTCRLCGECNVGCNYGSKNTLDYNYLTRALKAGADIRTRCEVRSFQPREGGRGYDVFYVRHQDGVTDTHHLPLQHATCDNLVLAAGTFGSTFLLLKNRAAFPALSPRLGSAFSGNGDILGLTLHSLNARTGAGRVINPSRGTVITSAIRMADALDGVGADGRGFYLEDAGYPEFVNWIAQTADVPGMLLRLWRFAVAWIRRRLATNPASDAGALFSALFGDGNLTRSCLPLLGMGRDVPSGHFTLNDGGFLDLDWSLAASNPYFERVRDTMRAVSTALDGTFQDDPTWYLSRLITVHPLGGCPMGKDPAEGVVSNNGEVFGYPGLYIADGSALPGPVGANPSLTIAACADRFADRLLGH